MCYLFRDKSVKKQTVLYVFNPYLVGALTTTTADLFRN